MKWSPQSPDMNIKDSLWDYLDQRKAEKLPKSKEHLGQVLKDAWNDIPMDWISPGGNTPQSTNYTATCLPSWKLSKFNKPDTQDTAGEAKMSS